MTNSVQAKYPIVMKCDNVAVPESLSISGGEFWQVPNGVTYFGGVSDDIVDLSLSGKHADDKLFLSFTPVVFNSGVANDIYTKQLDVNHNVAASSATSLRLTNNLTVLKVEDGNAMVTLTLFDMNGNAVLTQKGTMNKLIADLRRNDSNLPLSLYLARFIGVDGIINNSQKIVIGN